MKIRFKFLYLLFLPLFLLACSKKKDSDSSACITRIQSSTAPTVSQTNLDSINTLFRLNSLSTASLQFFTFLIDSVSYPGSATYPAYSGIQEQIQANLFINNLPVFAWTQVYDFGLGQFQPGVSYLYQGTLPNTDTSSRQTLTSLRAIYLANYQKAVIEGGPANSQPRYPSPTFQDSCLLTQLGYMDPFWFTHTPPIAASLVKTWKVSPLNGGWPTVFIEDGTGAAYPASLFLP